MPFVVIFIHALFGEFFCHENASLGSFVGSLRLFVGALTSKKLDGVGPVDNRPSTNKVHQIVRKKEEEKNCDMRHVTRDM